MSLLATARRRSSRNAPPVDLHTTPHPPHTPDSTSSLVSTHTQGGVSGAVAKTATAPIERVKLLIQTQDANPKARGDDTATQRRRWGPCS